MRENFLAPLGQALRDRRHARRMTQPMLAARLGKSPSRISELETDLLQGRAGKDRLGLLAEVCDALELVPILVPRDRAAAVRRILEDVRASPAEPAGRAFDDLFVDLSDDVADDVDDADGRPERDR